MPSRIFLGVRVLALYAVVEVLLRTVSLPRAVRLLGLTVGQEDVGTVAAARARRIRRVARVVAAVGKFWLFEATCLRQTLVAGFLLRSDRPVVAVGVRRTSTGEMTMHSWLEVAGRSVDPTSGGYDRIKIG